MYIEQFLFHPKGWNLPCLVYVENSTNEGETVIDPFMGIGSCGIASKMLNRNFIGCEIDPKYFEIAKNRIENNGNYVDNFKEDIFDF